MASNPITTTNLANWIPSVWSKIVLADMEKLLVTGALVDRRFEAFARDGGDKIVVPHMFNISANVVNTAADMTLYDDLQNVTNISIDKKYDIGVAVDDIGQLQTNPKYFDLIRSKISYGLAKQVDINTNVLFKSFNTARGTASSALTEDVLITCYEDLNKADVPFQDRAWVFDPASITDLLKLDFFIRMDYVPGSVVTTGFQGRQIFGAPVYISNNLDKYTSPAVHAGAYFHKEAIALVVQQPPKFEVARLPLRHSDMLSGLVLFGVQEMRDSFGVTVNTRA